MNLDKPSPKLDLAVAKAAGKNVELMFGRCHDCNADGDWGPWEPSADMTDAMEAMGKITDAIRSNNHLASLTPQSLFTLQNYGYGGWGARISPQDATPILAHGSTGPLAICAAILETEKGKCDA